LEPTCRDSSFIARRTHTRARGVESAPARPRSYAYQGGSGRRLTMRGSRACTLGRVHCIPVSASTESLLSVSRPLRSETAAAARSPATTKRRLDTEGAFAYARRRFVCNANRLPVQASGIALNVAAISGLLDLLVQAQNSRKRWLQPLSNMLCVESTLLIGLYLLRALG
jgi:hypothetical protein